MRRAPTQRPGPPPGLSAAAGHSPATSKTTGARTRAGAAGRARSAPPSPALPKADPLLGPFCPDVDVFSCNALEAKCQENDFGYLTAASANSDSGGSYACYGCVGGNVVASTSSSNVEGTVDKLPFVGMTFGLGTAMGVLGLPVRWYAARRSGSRDGGQAEARAQSGCEYVWFNHDVLLWCGSPNASLGRASLLLATLAFQFATAILFETADLTTTSGSCLLSAGSRVDQTQSSFNLVALLTDVNWVLVTLATLFFEHSAKFLKSSADRLGHRAKAAATLGVIVVGGALLIYAISINQALDPAASAEGYARTAETFAFSLATDWLAWDPLLLYCWYCAFGDKRDGNAGSVPAAGNDAVVVVQPVKM